MEKNVTPLIFSQDDMGFPPSYENSIAQYTGTCQYVLHSSAPACIFPFLQITQSELVSSLMVNITVCVIKHGGMERARRLKEKYIIATT
jgi:hypothetical protein